MDCLLVNGPQNIFLRSTFPKSSGSFVPTQKLLRSIERKICPFFAHTPVPIPALPEGKTLLALGNPFFCYSKKAEEEEEDGETLILHLLHLPPTAPKEKFHLIKQNVTSPHVSHMLVNKKYVLKIFQAAVIQKRTFLYFSKGEKYCFPLENRVLYFVPLLQIRGTRRYRSLLRALFWVGRRGRVLCVFACFALPNLEEKKTKGKRGEFE